MTANTTDHLLFAPRFGRWCMSLAAGLFEVTDAAVEIAAAFLPVCALAEDDDAAVPSGRAEVSLGRDGLEIACCPDGGATPIMVGVAPGGTARPALVLVKGRSTQTPWSLREAAWLLSEVRLEYENAAVLRCTYYLPPRASGSKRLLVGSRAGTTDVITLERDVRAVFEVGLRYPGRHRLDLMTEAEPTAEDQRPLGFVLLEIEALPGPAMPAERPDRLEANVREINRWLGTTGADADRADPAARLKDVLVRLGRAGEDPDPDPDPEWGEAAQDDVPAARGHLLFDTRRGEWLLSICDGLHSIVEPAAVAAAAAFLPIAVLTAEDDAAHPDGEAALAVTHDTLDMVLRTNDGGERRVRAGRNDLDLPICLWTRGRSVPASWGVASGSWLLSQARLICENAAGLRCTYYLPPGPAAKRLLVTTSAGSMHEIMLLRETQASFDLVLPNGGSTTLDFSTAADATANDNRPLGFVLLGLELLPAPQSAAVDARLRRQDDSLHALIRGIGRAGPRWPNDAPGTARDRLRAGSDVRRAAVVCWDLGHNPAGRAAVLYRLLEPEWEPDLIGPIWPRFGRDLWAPIRGEGLRHRLLPVRDLTELWVEAGALALHSRFDLVIVCKPRLPAMLIGLLIAEQSGCPILIDIDEAETAFTREASDDPQRELIAEPFGQVGTRLALGLLDVAASVTVSNPALQTMFGGSVVRHARDERAAPEDRAEARSRLGFGDADFVIAFVGTARPHKGLMHVLEAVERLDDDRVKLLVVGAIADPQLKTALQHQPPGRVVVHPGCPLAQLGSYLAAADLVPILQDPDSEIAQTQFPAKLVDALQHGIAIVASDVPPLRDVALRGVVALVTPETLAATIGTLRAAPRSAAARAHARRFFEEEFSVAVNRVRLAAAIRAAEQAYEPFPPQVPAALATLRQRTEDAVQPRPPPPRGRGSADAAYDIAFFWKQNDSGLYARRSDMVVKHLLASGRVRRIVHFDQAASIGKLREMALARAEQRPVSLALELPGTLLRGIGLADEGPLARRILLTHDGPDRLPRSFAGRPLAPPDALADHVRDSLGACGLDPATTLAWCCPVVWGFSSVVERIGFRGVILDLVDDQRTWTMDSATRARLEAEYAAALNRADLVFTNCAGNRARFRDSGKQIFVVPNGAELDLAAAAPPTAPRFTGLRGPIIGYAGNMSDRIDWSLLEALTAMRPDWHFVFVGPYPEKAGPERLLARDNVHFVGPIRHADLAGYLACFAVAIMPHLICEMTNSMNPLKLYTYVAAGLPVVTTPVANLEDLGALIAVRDTAAGFVEAIEQFLGGRGERSTKSGRLPQDPLLAERVAAFDWSRRVATMLEHVDAHFGRRGARPGTRSRVADQAILR